MNSPQQRSRIDGPMSRAVSLQATVSRAADPAVGDGAEPAAANIVLEFSFSSDEPYLRNSYEPWIEVLGHDPAEVDLSRLADGAPVLVNHGWCGTGDSPLDLVGITQKAWLDKGRGYVQVMLSRREGMEGLLQDIADGIVRNVSVGYQINERVLVRQAPDGEASEYRVTRWTPREVSFVDIPADATVGLGRSQDRPSVSPEGTHGEGYRVVDLPDLGSFKKGNEMTQAQKTGTETTAPVPTTPTVDEAALRRQGAEQERTRQADIRDAVRAGGLDETVTNDLITRGVSGDEARRVVLVKLAERSAASGVARPADIFTVRDESVTRREMITASLQHRSDANFKLPDGAHEYRGLTLLELSRKCLEQSGVNTRGMERMDIATRAFQGTSDLPNVLANVANKTLRQAYQAAPRTFTAWAKRGLAADFKSINRIALSDSPALLAVNPSGEFTRGAISDGKETYALGTFGRIVALNRQTIINDDLQAFTRIPALYGNAAANLESDIVYGILTANAVLADGVALFDATTHLNYTSSGTAISVTSLAVARALMRRQTTPNGAIMNLAPATLIVPAAKELLAEQYTSADYVSAQSSNINPFKNNLQVVCEARLDAASATAWYLVADAATIDTVEYCYLEGQEGVYIETRQGFDVDGMEIKARLDFAAKAIDYRGLYLNAGA